MHNIINSRDIDLVGKMKRVDQEQKKIPKSMFYCRIENKLVMRNLKRVKIFNSEDARKFFVHAKLSTNKVHQN